jgi:transposase
MSNPTRWVGVDLHRRRSQIAIIDEHGELTLQKRIPTGRETILELLGDPENTHVALEATYGWEWLAELLEDAGFDVHLARPLRTRAIAAARVKTDAVDARTLAHLLRTGLLPEAYIAPPELRDLRDLLRHRATLVHLRTSIKNRVHALLARQGILPEHSDLVGTGGREYLAALPLPDGPRRRLDSLIALISDFDREITETTSEIDQRARADERVKLLCQIRGIGRYTAMFDHRRSRRGQPLPHRQAPVPVGWPDPNRAQLRRQSPPRAHLPPRLHDPALGALRGGAAHTHRRRAAARPIRTDRQTPRQQDRESRDRPSDPHLRAARRRDPLPRRPCHRQRRTGGSRMTTATPPQACAPYQGARCKPGRARSCVWSPSHP